MKRKTAAFTTIMFTFVGLGWMIESQDRFNRGIIETDDPQSVNLQPVQYSGSEEEELPADKSWIREPFRPREYIRIVPKRMTQTEDVID
ncbi:hypothetical protein V6B33_20290 [Mangrovibacillus sp. Mu-81]|uniref:hypothetical protein n=1 Tax=Mangrovibacillus sp. Mu-81 TaxID=3121478 RepID=UPI002FE47156